MNNNQISPENCRISNRRRPRQSVELVEATTRRKIDFSADSSDSENEVFIDYQAHKKRRTMSNDEMKVWIEKQFATQMSKVATKEQVDGIRDAVAANTSGVKRNADDINDIKTAITTVSYTHLTLPTIYSV